jgi:hypothetical protein
LFIQLFFFEILLFIQLNFEYRGNATNQSAENNGSRPALYIKKNQAGVLSSPGGHPL